MAESTHDGPAPYEKGSDTVECPVCLKYGDEMAQFCDQCGSPLPGWGQPYEREASDTVPCGNCNAWNDPDAHFCDQCGRIISNSAHDAAVVASAVPRPTSSSWRQPMTPSERTECIASMNREAAERAALDVPAPTGRGELADAAAAEDHYVRIDGIWDSLDQQLRDAQAEAGAFPSPADAAELADLSYRRDAAWASRERARHHRDALMELVTYDGIGWPPGWEGAR